MVESAVQDEKFARMTEAPVEGLVIRMAIPTIIIMLISAMYNMADTYFVGSIGTDATAAVGVSFSLMAIIQAIGFFFGHGSGNYISRQMGAKNMEAAEKMATTGFFSSLIAGLGVTAAGLLFLEPLALFLGATETILPYACDYLRFILIGTAFMTGSLTLNNLLRFQGSAYYGMIGMTSGAILNIVLDPIFIFVLHMGVKGAALATIISQFVGLVILLIGCSRGGNIRIHPRHFSPSRHAYKEMARGGTPSLCRQGLASVATICLNQVAGGFSVAAIAAMSIVTRVTQMAGSALIGFGQGFQPVCGFNYGARRFDRVRRAFWFCVRIAFVALVVIAVIGFLLAPRIVAIFRDDPEVIVIGARALRFNCVSFPTVSWVILCNMMLQTIGKVAKANILAVSRQGMFLLPLLYLLTSRFGILGLQMAQPVADILTLTVSIPMGVSVLREMAAQQQGEDQPAENETAQS